MQDVCTDAEMIALLREAQRSDPVACDRLYTLYSDKIFRYLYVRLGQREVAEDLTADVFVRMLRELPRYRADTARPVAAFSAWLYRVASNLLTDHYRRQRHRRHLDISEQTTLPSSEPVPFHQAAAAEERNVLLDAVGQLGDEQQRVVLYRFADQLSVRDVASAMGKTEGAIKALQHRALENLRRILAATDRAAS
jgi:RNA polymerase sigma-70 factor, ECF subfamily